MCFSPVFMATVKVQPDSMHKSRLYGFISAARGAADETEEEENK